MQKCIEDSLLEVHSVGVLQHETRGYRPGDGGARESEWHQIVGHRV